MERAYKQSDEKTALICLDEMGPVAAKRYPGVRLVRALTAGPGPGDEMTPRGRAAMELDYGYRGGGHVYGALLPATGATLTKCYSKKRVEDWLDFLDKVERWIPSDVEHVVAVLDNYGTHRHPDVLLFLDAHPRWEFVFIPKYAGYLNLIEPWWRTLRSLALHGRRFENFDEVRVAVQQATDYWNAHKHPYVFGRGRRRKTPRQPGIAGLPGHRFTA